MGRLVIGALVAGVVMFILGFVFFATPLSQIGQPLAPADSQMVVQQALKSLPGTGTYFIPAGEPSDTALAAAHEAGPTALVKVNMTGAPVMDPMVLALGYLHLAASALLLGLVLWSVRDRVSDFAARTQLIFWTALMMAFFTRLGEPIWYRTDWPNALYVGFADFVTLFIAGLILARWFMPRTASS